VLHHLSPSLLPGGYVGVDVFFVISGYLITSIIRSEMVRGSFTFASFYERRVRRIFPAMFAVLTVTVVVSYFLLLPSDFKVTLRATLGILFLASNIVFWREMARGYFATADAELNPLLHTWSLAVEEQFYLIFPLLLLTCMRYFRSYIVLILAICALMSLAGATVFVQSKSVAVFFLSPFRAWELLVGALLAFNAVKVHKSQPWCEVVAGAGLLAILLSYFAYDGNTSFPGLAALPPVLGAAAIIIVGSSGPSLVGRLLQFRPLVYIGLISYSLYLWHWPLIVLTRYAMGMEPIVQYLPLLLVASLILGSLSYHFIEQPFRIGKRVPRHFLYFSSAVLALVMAGVAVLGLIRGGYEERFPPKVVQLDKARHPQILFRKECDGKPPEAFCRLGHPEVLPTVLLWGDSHMLAWAPALDLALNQQHIGAVFANSSACPPLFGIDRNNKPNCQAQNLAVKNYLLANPNIKIVVIAALWTTYFREDAPLTTALGGLTGSGSTVARHALLSTLQWLEDNGKQVVLIGPVPIYDRSVPLALALEITRGKQFNRSTADAAQKNNAEFFSAVATLKSSEVLMLDPIPWLCPDACMVLKDGIPLYRDSNHLSVAGAMALKDMFPSFVLSVEH
jgi:peptidoglycan/LPS O-acetylase OafA/YrhL